MLEIGTQRPLKNLKKNCLARYDTKLPFYATVLVTVKPAPEKLNQYGYLSVTRRDGAFLG